MTSRWQPAAALAAAVLALAAAGCGSSQAGTGSGLTGKAAAAKARSQVVSAARALYVQHVYGDRVGYATGIVGGYQGCGQSSSQLYYLGGETIYPLSHGTGATAFRQGIARSLSAAGWTVRKQSPPASAPPDAPYYGISKAGLTGDMYVIPGPPNTMRGVIGIRSPCFNPGKSRTLTVHFDHIALPHPAGASSQ